MTRLGGPSLFADLPLGQRAVALALTGMIGLVGLSGTVLAVLLLMS